MAAILQIIWILKRIFLYDKIEIANKISLNWVS